MSRPSLILTACLLLGNAGAAQAAEIAFRFRERGLQTYRLRAPSTLKQSTARPAWIAARRENALGGYEIGSRVILRLKNPALLHSLLRDRPLQLEQRMFKDCFLLRAGDALQAAEQAQSLSQTEGVLCACPEMRRPIAHHFAYAPEPSDPYFAKQNSLDIAGQWHLENRNTTGRREGIDLNIRGAWALSRGEGITIAIADDGVDLTHPDFINVGAPDLHYNFTADAPGGAPASSAQSHGTAVAGLAVAEGDNGEGVSGVAPGAQFASFPIFDSRDNIASGVQLAMAFGYESNRVDIQNHSWGNASANLLEPSMLEQMSVSNAATLGRGGKGVIFVRSGGNNRENAGNTNDDGYPNHPLAIAVAAIREDGRAASYSNPGACLLVGAPSGDSEEGFINLTTTDRIGNIGFNRSLNQAEDNDYAYGSTGFSGTSGAAPQISGVAALILSANPELAVRDVQQILIHSARQTDPEDPDLRENGAGFQFSHNAGFGVPDAGQAVRLAQGWINRPPVTEVRHVQTPNVAIPDDALRVIVPGAPVEAASIPSTPGVGLVPDEPTATVQLVDVGQALEPIQQDLTGKAALIQRGENFFFEKIDFAAAAGALFAVIYNNRDLTERITMAATDYNSIPSVFISQVDGEALASHLATNGPTLARLEFNKASVSFAVPESLLLEHVGLRVTTTHSSRGDQRITLISPRGTRSVLQRVNFDSAPGPVDWTYYSTAHFYESSTGVWRAEFGDASADDTGEVTSVELILRGVAIADADSDGLDDDWERAHFAHLGNIPSGDPDGDGYSNISEQIMGTDPNLVDEEFRIDIARVNPDVLRLSLPGVDGKAYELLSSSDLGATWTTNVLNGAFPETEVLIDKAGTARQFYQVREAIP